MQILTVDVGTGTQDIYLFQSGMAPENGFKLVMPSPTMMVRRKIRSATARGDDLLLVGVTMGGGPNTWAAVEHLRAGHKIFATPEAARTFDDDLDKVREMGVEVVSEDEAADLSLPRIELRDFDFQAIHNAFAALGADIDPQAVAVAVFDHGAAPADISDRQFRFDYIEARIRDRNNLSAFAYLATEIPPFMTRMRSVADSTEGLTCPLILMDTAPAAILGATLDPKVGSRKQKLIANIGNFHTLAFRMGPAGIEGVFEHHTGLVNLERVDDLLTALAHGTLTHEEIFAEHGHGALVIDPKPLVLQDSDFGVAVTGPRQSMLRASRMRPYFAVPFGDMMLSGCFGLVSACADLLPELSESIQAALSGTHSQVAPWDAEI
jgi:uncharacterized protein (DUF1786 family)